MVRFRLIRGYHGAKLAELPETATFDDFRDVPKTVAEALDRLLSEDQADLRGAVLRPLK